MRKMYSEAQVRAIVRSVLQEAGISIGTEESTITITGSTITLRGKVFMPDLVNDPEEVTAHELYQDSGDVKIGTEE